MNDTHNANEYEMVMKAREGDQEALSTLIAQNRSRLFALAYAELRNFADAQDAVASALLHVCLHIRNLRRPERMHAWMNSIVRNEARQLRRGPDAPLRLDDFPHESLSHDTLQAVLRNADITQALDRLSPKQAQAIRLFYFGQLAIREIALCMGSSEGTVKSWLHYGRQRLAVAMKEDAMTTSRNPSSSAAAMPLAELLKTYALQFDKDPLTADRALLDQTRERLKAELQRLPLSSELAHLAVKIHWNWVADNAFLSSMLAEYLQQPLPPEEEAWARYEYVVSLAVMGQNVEMVKQQKAALLWARGRWEAGQLKSQPLLQLISNSDLAERWAGLGLLEEWLAQLNDLLSVIPPDADNRMERFHALRSAGLRLHNEGRQEEAFAIIDRIRALGEEDPSWKQAYEMEVQADLESMRAYTSPEKTEEFLALATHASAVLEQKWPQAATMTREARSRLMIQYDNVACHLFFARRYELSIPLHRRSIELGYDREYGYLWLAAALWAHHGERAEALELLRQGRARTRSIEVYRKDFAELPEFQDVKDAPDFLEAVTGASV
ncbi:MAG: hypothetical protein JWL77_1674 [Chthonomonadaceae bacterium]|jgi:RNA polymerase sigma factor (sigma-70 family)|nr:hypothetical protein [Chthonomonadaceae bacterium]